MEYLLLQKNLEELKSFCRPDTIYAFDFDGTLAPIVFSPKMATMNKTTESLLQELCTLARVAIITGRGLHDMEEILPFKPSYVIGNHGLEGNGTDSELERIKELCIEWKKIICQELERYTDLKITIEDKIYSLSLHYRNSPDPETAKMYLLRLISFLPKEARIIHGKYVLNIVSGQAPNKGLALSNILEKEKCKFGIYIGDDHTDEDVFIDETSRFFTIRIGEDPDSNAKYFLNDQIEIDQYLLFLVNTLNRSSTAYRC